MSTTLTAGRPRGARRDFAARYGPWAVVTGASSGIGQEFARQLAAAGLALVVVARRRDRLEALAAELTAAHGVEVRVAEHDLAEPAAVAALAAAVAGLDVGLLVNNAGAGLKGAFVEHDAAELRRIIELNCQAPVALTRALAPGLVRRGRGGVIVVASTGGLQGLPWSTVYGASKGFDLLFGEGLGPELAVHGVDVLTLAPGGTDTEGPRRTGVDLARVKLMPVAPVVRAALAGLGRRALVIPGATNKLASLALRLVPRSVAARAAGRIMQRITRKP